MTNVAAIPGTVLMAWRRPHVCNSARELGPASFSAVAFELAVVCIVATPGTCNRPADAIGRVASADPETLQALKAAVLHESGIVRSAATRAFARIGVLLDRRAPESDEKTQAWAAEAQRPMMLATALPLLCCRLGGRRASEMVASDSFAEFLSEQLAPLGRLTLRRMFGKTGVFCDGFMLGMVRDNTLYFRVDDENREAFQEAQSFPPLNYEKKGGTIDLSFWRAPERLFDEPDELLSWARTALAAARRVAAKRDRATPRRSTKPRPT